MSQDTNLCCDSTIYDRGECSGEKCPNFPFSSQCTETPAPMVELEKLREGKQETVSVGDLLCDLVAAGRSPLKAKVASLEAALSASETARVKAEGKLEAMREALTVISDWRKQHEPGPHEDEPVWFSDPDWDLVEGFARSALASEAVEG